MENINNCECLIDLHLHLDGALSINNVKDIAKRQNIALNYSDQEINNLLTVSKDCKDLNEFLEKFAFPVSLLQTKEGLTYAVYNLCEELKTQGIIYAEIRFAPQLSITKGLSQDDVIAAAIAGLKTSDLKANLILCCMRGSQNKEDNLETVRLAKKYLGKGVVAVDLAGAEALFTTDKFSEEFKLARELNVPFTLHAGEACGPESVYKAIEFGANRIGHGVRSIEDPKLVDYLVSHKIPLELCPTSNIMTCIFKDIKDYPIRYFMEKGVICTINTDDSAVCGIDLKHEWNLLIKTFNLNKEEIRQLLLNSAKYSFADEETKEYLINRINQM